ncbi:MAG: UDP-N-acetylmuramoyl-L-alanine--D-glutamate ligase [Pseudomonadota bacterium]
MIPVAAYAGRRVGVLGLGRSGMATARALAAGGAEPLLWDDGEAARERVGAEFPLGNLARPREAASLAALIVSPGVPHLYPIPHPAVAAAREHGVPIDNEIGLFFAALAQRDLDWEDEGPEPKIVCITGSNGKSTTTALLHHVLRATGRPAQMGGNIGRAALDLDPPGAGETVVLELSSYQTELARSLSPDIAVFLNLQPDHLGRHGGMGGYFAAKRRLFEAGAPERAIIGIDEPEGLALAATAEPETLIRLSTARRLKGDGWSVFMNRNHLTEWRGDKQVAAFDLRDCPGLIGRHNHQNACAAWAAARALGLGPGRIGPAMAGFPGLAHRMERLGERGGVTWINDSKATNASASAHALAACERIRWIAGGRAKEDGVAALAPFVNQIAHAYFIGEAAERFAAELPGLGHRIAGTLEAAVAAAAEDAAPGDTILLSPAAASFDQFPDFEARGEAFRALARAHIDQKEPDA